MACLELDAFRVATESLDQRVLKDPRLGRANLWRNLVPRGTFIKGQGVTRSTFTAKTSEPQDNQALWNAITLTDGALGTCARQYEDVGVDFYERTYGPRERAFRGPVVCKKHLTFQHAAEKFLNEYVDQMGGFVARVWELTLRRDYLNFASIYVDGVKTSGPNALATAPRAYQGLTQSSLHSMATGMINTGAGTMADGYTTLGSGGPEFALEIDMADSESILRANSTMREDARSASQGMDGDGNFAVWKAIGANRIIGNFRHVATPVPMRLNYTGGAYQVVTPFKDISTVGTDSEILTNEYKNAAFGVAVAMLPEVFTCEVVLPANWRFPDASNYNGDWQFLAGGERICDPAEYDPLHEKGRHFAVISYAPAPNRVNSGAAVIYRRDLTPADDTIYLS